MKTLKTFENFTNEKKDNKVGDQAIGLDIKNEISKLIDGDGGTLDLGVVGEVSDVTISNISSFFFKSS